MRTTSDRNARRVFVWILSLGIALGGVAFAYKLAGFVFALTSQDFRGTFDVGIIVYLFISAGWLCLLLWCFLTGKFKQMERAKYDMLRQEEEYERLGI